MLVCMPVTRSLCALSPFRRFFTWHITFLKSHPDCQISFAFNLNFASQMFAVVLALHSTLAAPAGPVRAPRADACAKYTFKEMCVDEVSVQK